MFAASARNTAKNLELRLFTLKQALNATYNFLQSDNLSAAMLQMHYQVHQNALIKRTDTTDRFQRNVMDPIEAHLEYYNTIKQELLAQKLITADEMDEIEQTILKAAAKDSQALHDLIYFPVYQQLHEKKFEPYRRRYISEKEQNNSRYDTLEYRYSNRVDDYCIPYIAGAITSLFGIGLVIILITATIHLIDYIHTTRLLNQFSSDVNIAKQKLNTHDYPFRNEIDKGIESNTSDRIKQGFFSVAKTRLDPKIKVFDANYPKLHAVEDEVKVPKQKLKVA